MSRCCSRGRSTSRPPVHQRSHPAAGFTGPIPAGCIGGADSERSAVGRITREARPRGCLKYSFVASKPGTYTYHSGTQMPVQLEMGLSVR